jgi:hypothetical protein
MKRPLSWLLPGVLLWAVRLAPAAAPPPPLPEPLKGAVASGALVAAERDEESGLLFALTVPLRGAGPVRRVHCASANCLAVRWQVSHGAFWARWAFSVHGPEAPLEASEGLARLELAGLLRGKTMAAPDAEWPDDGDCRFGVYLPAQMARALGKSSVFEAEVYADVLPVGPSRVRQFVLTNARGRLAPAGKPGLLLGFRVEQSDEQKRTPVWSLRVHSCEAKWSKASRSWVGGPWQREESIEVGFKEPFQVLGRGEGYYFVTRSGRLFRAPPAAKGKPRRLEAVWADRRRPIEALLTDVDGGRTYLFCRPGKEGEKPTFFELGPKPRPVAYELAAARPGKRPEVLTRLLRYADTLLALKRLQLK